MKMRIKPGLYFLFSLLVLSFFFIRGFKGIQGDGIYYYSYTVSILWDGDLDLKNQFDHPDPLLPGQTVTQGLYSIDKKTGKAFSLFNPGTAFLMLPAAALGKLIDGFRGGRHVDPFDLYYQRLAGYTAVIVSALSLLVLFSILKRFYSFWVAAAVPLLFLPGTNWLFYASAFASWSHVYALFLFACLVWSFLKFMEKRTVASSILFGLAGGVFFSTRNFSVLIFLLLFFYSAYDLLRDKRALRDRRAFILLALAGLLFLVGSAPQLVFNHILHGSPFRTSLQAASSAQEMFGFPAVIEGFRVLDPANLQFLYSNLFNSDDGLFYFHPFFLVGLLGILLLRHRNSSFQRLINLLLAGLFFFWFIDASYFDNWFCRAAGAGFGHRRFLDVLPFFVLGSANILEWSLRRKWTRYVTIFVYAGFAAAGAALFYHFLTHYAKFYSVRDSFAGLYKFLLINWPALLIFSIVFLTLLLLAKPDKESQELQRRSPLAIMFFGVLFILPAFLFRGSPEHDRQRFYDKRGFFLMHSLTPYVRLTGEHWGLPENMARPMLFSSAAIELPAPLEQGDILQFKLTPVLQQEENQRIMTVYLGEESIGWLTLGKGKQVVELPVPQSKQGQRKITITFEGKKIGSPSALFHEGRVVFRECDDPPFGHIDLPPEKSVLGSGGIAVEGWALDDRRVRKVLIKREPLPDEKEPLLDDDDLITLGEAEFQSGTRPDVETVFVLYPAIDRAGWVFRLDQRLLPECAGRSIFIQAIAYDGRGQRSQIGRRELICENSHEDD
ncbi:MAG: hypothetical protein QHH14_13400 [Clostridiales bacterium]|nr:hypothetical protein [Clostridiales bacterium]